MELGNASRAISAPGDRLTATLHLGHVCGQARIGQATALHYST
jgi:hypothetical protein